MMESPLILSVYDFWDGLQAHFLILSFLNQFWALFPLARTPTQNSGAIGQILRYMSEIFFGASCDGGTRCPSWHKLKSNFQYIGTP